jgi:outer membrane lipoprotein-sorting protein
VLLLAPRKKDDWRIRLNVREDTLVPTKTVLTGKNITIITTTDNYVLNPSLDRKMFTFQPPAGTEVLHVP